MTTTVQTIGRTLPPLVPSAACALTHVLVLALVVVAACDAGVAEERDAVDGGAGGQGGASGAGGTAARGSARAGSGTSGGSAAGGRNGAARRDAGAGDRPSLMLCSGCPTEPLDPTDAAVRVHHIHMNVKSAAETVAFYEKFFAAQPVWLNETETAIWAAPILILLDEVDHDLAEPLEMGLEHIGMGVDDVTAWFDEKVQQGLAVDVRNGAPSMTSVVPALPALTPFLDPGVQTFAYVYVRGPNHERVEVWSGLKRFRHIHFMSPNVDATVEWYSRLFGVRPIVGSASETLGYGNAITLGNDVQLFYAGMPVLPRFIPTDDRPVSHIAFSVSSLDAAFEHAESLGLEVVSPPAPTRHGFHSFFLRGPESVLVEYVQAGPVHL